MSSMSGTTDSSADYLCRTDGFCQAFLAACKEGLKDKHRGPTVAQYLAEPEIASALRRSAAELRVSVDGELIKFRPMMDDKKKATSKFLIVSNPDYVMGTATFQDVSGAVIVSEKAEKDKTKKSKGNEKVVRMKDEDDNGNYDYHDSTIGY